MNVSEAFALNTLPVINAGSIGYVSGVYDTIEMLQDVNDQYDHLRAVHQRVAMASHDYAVTRMSTAVHDQESVQQWYRQQLKREVPLAVQGESKEKK